MNTARNARSDIATPVSPVRAAIAEAVIPASRSIRPFDYIEPRRNTTGALETCSGLVIGGALPRPIAAANDGSFQCAAVEMTADAIAIQAALTDSRADKPRLIDEVRGLLADMKADPKIGRRLRLRLYDATVKPVLAWL